MKEPMKTRLQCLVLAALSAACQRVDRSAPAGEGRVMSDTTAPPASPAAPTPSPAPPTPVATKVAVVEGFLTPESVKYDTAQDVYFVSNVNGGPLAKDNNGFISRVRPDGQVTVAVRGDTLGRPNGITLDSVGKRFIVVQFGGRSVLAWKPGEKAPSVIAKGPGGFDGVEIAGNRLLVSSWADSTVSSYETGQEVKVITGVPSPADIGYDAKRKRVLVPIFTGNRCEIWQLPCAVGSPVPAFLFR